MVQQFTEEFKGVSVTKYIFAFLERTLKVFGLEEAICYTVDTFSLKPTDQYIVPPQPGQSVLWYQPLLCL